MFQVIARYVKVRRHFCYIVLVGQTPVVELASGRLQRPVRDDSVWC